MTYQTLVYKNQGGAKLTAVSGGEIDVQEGAIARGLVQVAERTFTETTGAGTYTAAVAVPAGATVIDVVAANIALWTATTSATLNVGDDGDADGIFAGVDVKAAPAAGAYLSYLRKDAGVGAYAGTKRLYYSAAATIIGTIVTVGAAGSAGRTRLVVTYSVPQTAAATKA